MDACCALRHLAGVQWLKQDPALGDIEGVGMSGLDRYALKVELVLFVMDPETGRL